MAGHTGADRPSVADLLARSEERPVRGRLSGRPRRSSKASRHSGRQGQGRRRKARHWVIGAAVALVLLVAFYYIGLLAYIDNAVERADVLRLSGPEITAAERQQDAENFLLFGSDGGDRDTTILAHLSEDGSDATVIVFPGDAYVDVPACEGADRQPTEPYSGAFGSVYETGGAGCLVRTVQVLTGLRINHYVQMDLTGFPAMVDALGGVPVCLGSAVSEAGNELDLPAGPAVIDGEQTLPFLRLQARPGPAATERIERQQQFLASLLDRSLAARTVANPVRLTRFVNAAADSLTLDPDTTLGDLKNLVDLLRDLSSESVLLLTAPIADPAYTPVGSSTTYQLFDEQLGRQLYQSVIADSATALPPNSALPTSAAPSATGVDCG
ncbi:MAG: LCP family protein [Geodermatophilaceae bacterium]